MLPNAGNAVHDSFENYVSELSSIAISSIVAIKRRVQVQEKIKQQQL
jgi:hypothetical protein